MFTSMNLILPVLLRIIDRINLSKQMIHVCHVNVGKLYKSNPLIFKVARTTFLRWSYLLTFKTAISVEVVERKDCKVLTKYLRNEYDLIGMNKYCLVIVQGGK